MSNNFLKKDQRFPNEFSAISLSLASPEKILGWSHGEVLKPETINYRTQKPERDGLFCERIFGPVKNWECACGKYKKVKYKDVVCEKCGVKVTRASVRRERLGHIKLAVPVTHIWFLRSTPSRIGLLLHLSIKQLEQITSFAAYVIKEVHQEAKEEEQKKLEENYKQMEKEIKTEAKTRKKELAKEYEGKEKELKKETTQYEAQVAAKLDIIHENYVQDKRDLDLIKEGKVIDEPRYVTYRLDKNWGHVFEAGIGAEAIREMLEKIDLDKELEKTDKRIRKTTGQKKKRLMKRQALLNDLKYSEIRPEWMVTTILPVIPPDLRPMVELEGGRYAASDLNDLYRRVINRNNRLKRLIELNSPEVICRNEKRMLQEAVDALINNSARAGKAIFTAGDRRKYKSLSDMLKGKQGRFRQNLLGKRVDYSGRSVIVVNPHLKMHQCGIPKVMALELFRPFVIGRLIRDGYAYNIKNAERLIDASKKEVWDMLENVTKNYYVLLNRAPTLHRLGIQAFQPVLIEGKSIQVHPLVCSAFNADFDGDMMAVHVPLSQKAQREAKKIMVSTANMLKPADGDPHTGPSQEMILGCYYITGINEGKKGEGMSFSSREELKLAYDLGYVHLQAPIKILHEEETLETSLGRILFNEIVPSELGFRNEQMNKKKLNKLVAEVFEKCGREKCVQFCDDIKDIGYKYSTVSGLSMSIYEFNIPETKKDLLDESAEKVKQINNQYRYGFITDQERYRHIVTTWLRTKKDIEEEVKRAADKESAVWSMIDSGSRGNIENLNQVAGMKGAVVNPSGETIELPVKSSLKEGFAMLEYFIACHAGRKGKADTALKTSESGYLTRRLVDAVQDVIVRESDCGTDGFSVVERHIEDGINESFADRLYSRVAIEAVADPESGEVIVDKLEPITKKQARAVEAAEKIESVKVRSVMYCRSHNGVCQKCYGIDLADGELVRIGTPVGIIAAQSIGEPGTQLTMRTFHSGGVASEEKDITQGLTRVEELFEARVPKPRAEAAMAPFDGKVKISREGSDILLRVTATELGQDVYPLINNLEPVVKKGEEVVPKQIIAKQKEGKDVLKARHTGKVNKISQGNLIIDRTKYLAKEFIMPRSVTVKVKHGDLVKAGMPLTSGHLNLKKLLKATDPFEVQRYIASDIKQIYMAQGVSLNSKHIEMITNRILSRVKVLDPGNSTYIHNELVDRLEVENLNAELKAGGKKEVHYEQVILGLSKASLETDSWLSAASFQETIRVLIKASLKGQTDQLAGLKENVIIGKLIPAGEHYRQDFLGELE